MGWPQIIVLMIFVVRIAAAAVLELNSTPGPKIGFVDRVFDALIFSGLLWWGGFWNG